LKHKSETEERPEKLLLLSSFQTNSIPGRIIVVLAMMSPI
jgi:hypothetical protein